MAPSASDHAILAVDVEGFGDRRRTDPVLVTVRAAVNQAVVTAFARAGIPWDRCYHEGCGDGLFVLIPSDVPKRLLGAPLPRELAAALREHNATCQTQARIRLRAAVHAGQVRHDAHGVAGTALNRTFRLLNAKALRSALAQSPGVLALIASDWFFDDVIRHDTASDPGAYRRVRVSVKETKGHAWVTRPDSPFPPARRRRVLQAAAAGVVLAGVVATVTASGMVAPPPPDGDDRIVADAPPSTTTQQSPGSTPPDPEGGNPPEDGAGPTTTPSPRSPGTSTHQGTTTPRPDPATTSEPQPPPSSAQRSGGDPVQEERSVQLSDKAGQESVEIDWWRQNHERGGDLQVDATGAVTTLGAKLVVVEDSLELTRDRCEQVTSWTTRVDFTQLHVGSQLCARSVGGRYAMLQVQALPDSPGSNGRFVFYGTTWKL
jgi:hypothetical protein